MNSTRRAEIEAETGRIARALRSALDSEHMGRVGFCLLLFDFGETGSFAYASSGQRANVIALLEEAIFKLRADTTAPSGRS